MRQTRKLTISALFMALGIILPFLTGQVQGIGNMLLPMHIPVLLCGYICGWQYGLLVGFVTPLLRSVLVGMPVLVPVGVSMAFELAAYGAVAGFLYQKYKGRLWGIYVSLLAAMIAGRCLWGLVSALLYGAMGNTFTWKLFVAGAVTNAMPGILLQLIVIPLLIILLKKAGVMTEYD